MSRAGRQRSAKRQLAAATLLLEAFVVGFAALVAYGLRVAPEVVVWSVGGALALALLLLAGLLRLPGAYWAGSVLQVLVVATGIAVPTMYVVGGIFAVMWFIALRLGGRIDAERSVRGGS